MNSIQHGKEEFDKKYYGRFFKENGDLDFATYQNWFQGWYNFVKRYAPIEEHKNKRVLEVGTAIGAFAKILTDRGFDVTATDISDFILSKAKAENKDARFLKVDIEKPIKLGVKYDYVFAFEVLEHLKDPKKAMKNIRDVLTDEGYFIFSSPFLSEQTLKDPTHISVHDPDWWQKAGEEAGFTKVNFTYVSFLPFLYKLHKLFSVGIPVKINSALANSTSFYFFKK